MDRELTVLKIKSLIADKEMEIERARREDHMGGWLYDHGYAIAEINELIENLFNNIGE